MKLLVGRYVLSWRPKHFVRFLILHFNLFSCLQSFVYSPLNLRFVDICPAHWTRCGSPFASIVIQPLFQALNVVKMILVTSKLRELTWFFKIHLANSAVLEFIESHRSHKVFTYLLWVVSLKRLPERLCPASYTFAQANLKMPSLKGRVSSQFFQIGLLLPEFVIPSLVYSSITNHVMFIIHADNLIRNFVVLFICKPRAHRTDVSITTRAPKTKNGHEKPKSNSVYYKNQMLERKND